MIRRRIAAIQSALDSATHLLPAQGPITVFIHHNTLHAFEDRPFREAVLAGREYRPLIDPPYRWRDWAADPAGISGPDLLAFIGGERTTRPDGTEGPGLFAYLRNLRGNGAGRERRDVIAAVFRELKSYATSGYVLRDVVNLLHDVHFDSTEDVHVLGHPSPEPLRDGDPDCVVSAEGVADPDHHAARGHARSTSSVRKCVAHEMQGS